MPLKPRTNHKPARNAPPLVAILRHLVLPSFEEQPSDPAANEPGFELIEPDPESCENPYVRGHLRDGRLFHIQARPVDDVRSTLRISLLVGHFIDNSAVPALLVGNLLAATPFHVHSDYLLGRYGQMSVGCDLIVRDDDEPLVRRRLGELLKLADDFDWFFPLRMPNRLDWQGVHGLEMDWSDLPHNDLEGFLDEGLNAPPRERTPLILLRLAQGLGRWQNVLQLLREHPDTFLPRESAPLKCQACRQLRRWLPAIRAAKEGGIRNGRFPKVKWLSPSYMHALIEGGDDIEALRLLGKPTEGEPGFYDWLRGLAFHRAGDRDRATEAFGRYFTNWPGDIPGAAATDELIPSE